MLTWAFFPVLSHTEKERGREGEGERGWEGEREGERENASHENLYKILVCAAKFTKDWGKGSKLHCQLRIVLQAFLFLLNDLIPRGTSPSYSSLPGNWRFHHLPATLSSFICLLLLPSSPFKGQKVKNQIILIVYSEYLKIPLCDWILLSSMPLGSHLLPQWFFMVFSQRQFFWGRNRTRC